MTIQELLRRPPSRAAAQAILEHVRELPGRVVRGEMTIGILSVEEIEQLPFALEQAASHGEPAAWLELARWHASPPFGKQNLLGMERALRSARAGEVPGTELELVRLRWFYRRKDASPGERREAWELASKLAAEEPRDPVAAHLLGLLTCQGFGTEADPAAAVALQRTAASLGSAEAMFELYVHHETGLGVEQDAGLAFEWARKAAEAGHPRAMYNMGAFHATGRHAAKDPTKAAEWYQRASDSGNLRGTAMLAVMYARGEGVSQDRDYAGELFDEADYMGFDTSQLRKLVGLQRADRPE